MTYPTARPTWPSDTGMAEVSASMAQLLSDEPEAMAAVFTHKWTIDPANPDKWIRAEFELTRTPTGLSDRRTK